MAHYAQIINNIVQQVVVIKDNDTKTLDSLKEHLGGQWIQTSYNSFGGVHYDSITKEPDNKNHIRYNFAGIGHVYDPENDAFYYPEPPFPSWTLNKTTYTWAAPIPIPTDVVTTGRWNEETQLWETIPSPYPSWICVNNTWQPPISAPAETGWDWDEEDKIWYKAHPLVPDIKEE